MATLNFPQDPVFGDVYEFGSYTYKWDGEKWKTIGTGSNPTNELRKEVFPKLDITNTYSIEALRRSYAEAGYSLVDGSFETGGTLTATTDVLLNEKDGKAYSWTGTYPSGGYVVAPGVDPAAAGFVARNVAGLRSDLASPTGSLMISHTMPAGGKTRVLSEKLSDYVSIDDYASLDDLFLCLGGADKTGYGANRVIVDLCGKTVNIDGVVYVPVNIGFRNGAFAAKNGTSDKLVFRNPWVSGTTGRSSYTDFWPYMKSRNEYVDFWCITVINCYFSAVFESCTFNGLVMVNSNSLWTEFNSFRRCEFRCNASVGAAIRLDGNSSGTSSWSTGSGAGTSDGSFGYNNWEPNCIINSEAPVVGMHVTGGAVLYNAHLGFQGYARGANGAWLWVESGAVNQCQFEVHLESFGAASYAIILEAGTRMWYNYGYIVSASPEIGMRENGIADMRANNISVVGIKLYAPNNSEVFNGASLRSLAINSIRRRRYSSPSFSAYNSSGLTIASNVQATVPLAGVEIGSEYMSGNKFFPKVSGNYSVAGRVGLTVTASAQVAWVAIARNGTILKTGDSNNPDGKTALTRQVSAVIPMNGTTDYLELVVFVFDNGGAPFIEAGASTTYFGGHLVGVF